jgi:hypothetical protein
MTTKHTPDSDALAEEFTGKLTTLVVQYEARGLSVGSVVGALLGFAVGAMRGQKIDEMAMLAFFEETLVQSRTLGEAP